MVIQNLAAKVTLLSEIFQLEYFIICLYFALMNKKEISVKKIKLGALLYKTRNELKIKQTTLQQEGIISQSHLSKIENGEMNISAILLYELAKRYGKDIEYFLKDL